MIAKIISFVVVAGAFGALVGWKLCGSPHELTPNQSWAIFLIIVFFELAAIIFLAGERKTQERLIKE